MTASGTVSSGPPWPYQLGWACQCTASCPACCSGGTVGSNGWQTIQLAPPEPARFEITVPVKEPEPRNRHERRRAIAMAKRRGR